MPKALVRARPQLQILFSGQISDQLRHFGTFLTHQKVAKIVLLGEPKHQPKSSACGADWGGVRKTEVHLLSAEPPVYRAGSPVIEDAGVHDDLPLVSHPGKNLAYPALPVKVLIFSVSPQSVNVHDGKGTIPFR
jgi:hypothetical protein